MLQILSALHPSEHSFEGVSGLPSPFLSAPVLPGVFLFWAFILSTCTKTGLLYWHFLDEIRKLHMLHVPNFHYEREIFASEANLKVEKRVEWYHPI